MKKIDNPNVLDLVLAFISNHRNPIEINVSIRNKDGSREIQIFTGKKETIVTFTFKILLLFVMSGLYILSDGNIIHTNQNKSH
ncbi:MAG TPA: hypothetical protein PK079_21245 [Leptospiraceae bacterium]|nr:hypothetical protein [Leptospiraceae bacterium]HMW06638.1 hypothetical protein [Leptospiraceae bacterium]HMX34268.1 hypothetical protein [Leptospiraceae bacterium]HMY32703.1 hypothetical protein [Leptospiraceae bacterium]HMZ64893.1 hypothetical protein [Leptospiraceae bacterium]